jgi:glycosyltransferase involved in cell wall biosynthesis
VQDFTLWVSDDASTDGTWGILSDYSEMYPGRVKLTARSKNSGGAKYNFLEIMSSVSDDYLMLCDQDDVWLPDKIEKTLFVMKEMEHQHPETPVLVRTDMKVVDHSLQVISDSYERHMCSDFSRDQLNHVLIQNTFAGCTAMYNMPLARLLDKKPNFCVMHDWWLELVAAAFGKIGCVRRPTMLYRQHGSNSIGAKDFHRLSYKLRLLASGGHIKSAIRHTYMQAESFLKIFGSRLDTGQRALIKKYCAIPSMSKINRLRTICRMRAFKNGFSRNVGYFLFV